MKILVLGGTRFIGPRVVTLLAQRGHDVTIFHRGETETDLPASVRHIHAPFASLPERLHDLRDEAPEVVVDIVPYLDKDGHGFLHFQATAQRAVVITSCDVYRAFGRLWRSEPGRRDPLPLTEDSPLRSRPAPDSGAEDVAYDNIDVERAIANVAGFPVTVLRLPATHGPGDPQHRLFGYVQRMSDNRPAIMLEEKLANWRWVRGYVENVAAAIALTVVDPRAAGRIYNVAEQTAYTEAEWVRRIGKAAGWAGEVVPVPRHLLPASLRLSHDFDFTQDYVVDSTRIRSELGYKEPVNEDDALRQTIEWERHNPPAPNPTPDYEAEDAALLAHHPERLDS